MMKENTKLKIGRFGIGVAGIMMIIFKPVAIFVSIAIVAVTGLIGFIFSGLSKLIYI